jgi:hypothetical protein
VAPGVGAERGIEVPPFARCMHLICMPNNAQVLVEGFSDAGHTNQIVNYPVVAYPSGELLIPNDIEHVVDPGIGISFKLLWLHNAGQANVTNWRAIFSLEL